MGEIYQMGEITQMGEIYQMGEITQSKGFYMGNNIPGGQLWFCSRRANLWGLVNSWARIHL